MATSPAPVIGTVSTLIGQAFVREPNGQMRPLRLGDVIREGDVIVLADGARLEMSDEAGAVYIPREGEALTAAALTPAEGARTSTASASEDIDRVIASLEPGATNSQDAPAAGLTADGGGEGMTPGLRVERVAENLSSRELAPPSSLLGTPSPAGPDTPDVVETAAPPAGPGTPSDLLPPQVSITPANPLLSAGESTTVTFDFTEPIAGFDQGAITVTGGTLSGLTQTGPSTWTAIFTQAGTEQPSITIGAGAYADMAGNAGSGAHLAMTADWEAPALAITSADALLAAGQSTTVTFAFSEQIQGFDISDVVVTGGTLSDFTQTGPSTWTATFTQTGSGTPTISVASGAYGDAAGNSGSGASLVMTADTAAPTLSITAADTLLAAGESTTVTFTFSEAVAGFDASDITVAGGSISGLTQTGPTTWTATFTQAGADAPSVAVASGSYTDLAGNSGSGASLAMTADTAAPTLTITAADTLLAAGESTTVTFAFSEEVAGFDASDITVVGGTLSGLTTTDNITWTATFTQTGGDAPSVNVAAGSYTDVAGNIGAGASLAMTADTAAPTLTITAADTLLAAGESTTVTFNFSEAVNGFDASDVSVTGGTLSGLTQTGPTTWTATFTQAGTDAPSVAVASGSYTDLAGNGGSGASLAMTADTAAPTLTITAADTLLAAGESTALTFSFSEEVTGFEASDIAVTGGSISGLTQTGPTTWTATFTQTGTDSPSVSVPAGSYTDIAGNTGDGASLAMTADTAAPTLSITAADTLLAAGESTTVTFTFSEDVVGFDASDITIAGGTLNGLAQTGPSTWTATFTQSGSDAPSISVGAGSYSDLAGNSGAGASLALTADTAAPTLSITAVDTVLAAGESTTLTFSFSEEVTGFDASDITVSGGTLSGLTQTGPSTWTATFTQTGTDSPSVSVPAGSYTDLAGNTGSGSSLVMTADTAAPTLSITAADTLLAAGESTTLTFSFSEEVAGFEASDIAVTGGSISNWVQTSPTTWTATFTQIGGDAPSVNVAAGSYADLAGNSGGAASLVMTADTAAPTLTITAADTLLAAGESTTVTFAFSEEVAGFDASDITVAGGTLSGLTQTGPTTWTATFTQTGGDAPSVNVAAGSYTDVAGNTGAGASLAMTADTAAPTLSITAADTLLAAGESTTVTFTFSEAVAGFDASDITVAGGSISGLTQTGPTTWTATFTQAGSETPSVSVAAGAYTDIAGNTGAGASLAMTADTAAPTLTITAADALLTAGASTTLTFSFSEEVTGFEASDITVVGGSISGLTQTSPTTWTATFTQAGSDTPSVSVPAGAYTDVAGNDGGGASLSISVDIAAPIVDLDASEPGTGFTVTFTENGSPVSIGDVDLSITDADSTILSGATVTLDNAQADDVLAVGALPPGITATVAGNTITFTGSASLSDYETALRSVTFQNTSENPDITPRSITVSVTDALGNVSTPAQAIVQVVAVDDAPVHSLPAPVTMQEDTQIYLLPGTYVTDVDSDSITTTISVPVGSLVLGSTTDVVVSGNGTGTVVLSGTPSAVNSALIWTTYTPPQDYNGGVDITVSTTDGTSTVTDTLAVSITPVNDAPVAVNDSFTTAEDTAVTIAPAQLLANDTDVDGDPLSVVTIQNITNGTVSVVGGNIVFTPNPNYHGPASFNYTISDGRGGFSTARATIDVLSVDDLPETADVNASGAEDSVVAIALSGSDADNVITGYVIETLPANGVLYRDAALTQVVAAGDVVSETTLYFQPADNWNGSTSFQYAAQNDAGISDPTPATVVITVTPVNDAPVAVNDSFTTAEDTAITISLAQLLANDTDVDGDTLTVVTLQAFTNGTVSVVGGNIVFTPNPNYHGPASFNYTISDGRGGFSTATANISVTPVNDAPQAVDDGPSMLEGLRGEYFAYVEGMSGPNLTSVDQVRAFVAANTADAVFNATTLTYNQIDGNLGADGRLQAFLGSDAASLSVDPVNSSDAILRFTGTLDLAAGTYILRVRADDGYSIMIDGVVVAEVNANQAPTSTTHAAFTLPTGGAHSIDIVYWDQGGQAVFGVELSADNGSTFQPLGQYTLRHPTYTTAEDTALVISTSALLANDSDPEGDALSVISVQGAVNGSVALVGGQIVFTPAADHHGPASFTYTVSDGNGGTSTATVSLNVLSVNDLPTTANVAITGAEDTVLTVALSGADIDGTVAGYVIGSLPANGTLYADAALTQTIAAGGFVAGSTVYFRPNVNWSGSTTFQYAARDNDGGTDGSPATATLTVTPVNDAPVNSVPGAQTFNEDTSRVFSIANGNAITVADVDSTSLTTSLSVSHGTLTLGATSGVTVSGNGTGTVTLSGSSAAINAALNGTTYTPAADVHGATTLTVTTSDGSLSTTSTVPMNIAAVADIPLLGAQEIIQVLNPGNTMISTGAGMPSNFTRGTDHGAGVSVANLEAELGLAPGALSQFNPPGSHAGNVTAMDGKLTTANYSLSAGTTVNFNWSFLNGENDAGEIQGGYNDLVILVVTDPAGTRQAIQITSSEQAGAATGTVNGTYGYTATSAGSYKFDWVIVNGRDAGKDSRLSLNGTSFSTAGTAHGAPVALALFAALTDTDGSESLSVMVSGVPSGARLSSGTDLGSGVWSLSPADLAGLQLLPASGYTGTINLNVTAVATESSNGSTATATQAISITIAETGSTIHSGTEATQTINSNGNSADLIHGYAGNDTINAGNGNDLVHGGIGNDTLNGDGGNDALYGGAGNDTLNGGAGNDILVGGTGNDTLTGGTGADVFRWNFGDGGIVGTPAVDTITDFNNGAGAQGDVLDLRDLLVGESHGNLSNYLHFSTSGSGASTTTTISISTTGGFAGGFSTGAVDQVIQINNVDLVGSFTSDQQVIQDLLTRGKLLSD